MPLTTPWALTPAEQLGWPCPRSDSTGSGGCGGRRGASRRTGRGSGHGGRNAPSGHTASQAVGVPPTRRQVPRPPGPLARRTGPRRLSPPRQVQQPAHDTGENADTRAQHGERQGDHDDRERHDTQTDESDHRSHPTGHRREPIPGARRSQARGGVSGARRRQRRQRAVSTTVSTRLVPEMSAGMLVTAMFAA